MGNVISAVGPVVAIVVAAILQVLAKPPVKAPEQVENPKKRRNQKIKLFKTLKEIWEWM